MFTTRRRPVRRHRSAATCRCPRPTDPSYPVSARFQLLCGQRLRAPGRQRQLDRPPGRLRAAVVAPLDHDRSRRIARVDQPQPAHLSDFGTGVEDWHVVAVLTRSSSATDAARTVSCIALKRPVGRANDRPRARYGRSVSISRRASPTCPSPIPRSLVNPLVALPEAEIRGGSNSTAAEAFSVKVAGPEARARVIVNGVDLHGPGLAAGVENP